MKNINSEVADLDYVLNLIGFGRFHYGLIGFSALCLLAAGCQNGLSAYLLPAAQCDLKLTSAAIGFINASFLIGGTCSAFLWGILADITGRRTILKFSLLLDFIVTMLCSTIQGFVPLIICRFANGFLIGAPSSLIFTYISEFYPTRNRTKIVCYSGIFFTLSWLLLPFIAWLILPLPINFKWGSLLDFSSWRLFLLILTLPELLAGCWLLTLPESPKYLLAKGDEKGTMVVLKKMFSVNFKRVVDEFPIRNLRMENLSVHFAEDGGRQCRSQTKRLLHYITIQMKTLFTSPLLPMTILVSFLMFCNMFGYFGLGLWIPELLSRFIRYQTAHPSLKVKVSKLYNNTQKHTLQDISCETVFDTFIFESTMAIGVSCLMGNMVSGYVAGKMKRNVLPILSMILGSVSAGSIYWMTSFTENLIAICVFQSALATGNMVMGSVIIEMFPTSVNAAAICLATCAGRLGAIFSNILFGMLVDKKSEVPIFMVSGVLLLGAFAAFFIPETDSSSLIRKTVRKRSVSICKTNFKSEQVLNTIF